MMTRSDVHSPSHLTTEDYEFVTVIDTNPDADSTIRFGGWWHNEMQRLNALVATSSVGRDLNQCHHCGAHLRYAAVLHHLPTGTYIAVGETCLENRFERATADFQACRKAAALNAERGKIRKACEAFALACPDLAWMSDSDARPPVENDFIADVAAKLRRYGSLSDRQIAAVRKVLAAPAPADEPKVAAGPVPTGVQQIEGLVVGFSDRINPYSGFTDWRMIVRLDNGSRVLMTIPKYQDPEKGDRVRVTVDITAAGDDTSFGFGKRPRKFENLGQAAADAADTPSV